MIQWNRRNSGAGKALWAKSSFGFNLPELMVVILILGILVGIAIPVYLGHQAKTRDGRRLSDIQNVEAALDSYKFNHDCFPPAAEWDDPSDGNLISVLTSEGLMDEDVTDPSDNTNYRYCCYSAGAEGADPNLGDYYVLGIVDLEKSGRPHKDSPGWQTPGRDWSLEFDWVVGCFTHE